MKFFIVAGEASGDVHGANLARELSGFSSATAFSRVENILKINGSFLNTSIKPIIAISESVKYCFCPKAFKLIPPVPENSAFGYIFKSSLAKFAP